MGTDVIPSDIREFIFDHIDSAELLEIIFLLRLHQDRWWTTKEISLQLFSTQQSVESRLVHFKIDMCLEAHASIANCYKFKTNEKYDALLERLAEEYRIRRHAVLELVFSPLKRTRQFAQAFVIVRSAGNKKEDSDG